MSYTNLHYHIVFSTKNRVAVMDETVMPRLCQYFGGIIRELDGTLLLANGPADHIHLATTLSPKLALTDFLRTIKTNTSRWIHQNFAHMGDFRWQDGYSAFSVSHSAVPKVIRYIRNQIEHHRTVTFEEELRTLLRRHNIDYDEKCLLG